VKKIVLSSSVICLAAAAAVVGCSNTSDTAATSTTTSKATAAFNSADKALASSISSGAASSLAFAGSKVDAKYVPDSSTYCAPSGSPLAIGSETGSDHTDNGITSKYLTESGQEVLYGRRFWWCMMNHPSAGPDTVRGSIMKLKGFMCEVDRATGSGFVFDGQSHTITISLSTTCFTDEFVQMASNAGITSTSMTYTASTTPSAVFSGANNSAWTHAININFPDINMGYKILMNMPTDESEVSAMVQQSQVSSGVTKTDAYGFSMSYSGANATIRYEGRFDDYSDSTTNSWKRHIRTIATGVYSGNGGFSSITSSKGVYANVYRNSGSTSYEFRTVNATSAGIKTDTWSGSAANYAALDTTSPTHGDNACYSGCSITSLMTVGASALPFLQLSTAATSTSVFPQISPLSFSTIDLTSDLP
jgi:hypothetical protein